MSDKKQFIEMNGVPKELGKTTIRIRKQYLTYLNDLPLRKLKQHLTEDPKMDPEIKKMLFDIAKQDMKDYDISDTEFQRAALSTLTDADFLKFNSTRKEILGDMTQERINQIMKISNDTDAASYLLYLRLKTCNPDTKLEDIQALDDEQLNKIMEDIQKMDSEEEKKTE